MERTALSHLQGHGTCSLPPCLTPTQFISHFTNRWCSDPRLSLLASAGNPADETFCTSIFILEKFESFHSCYCNSLDLLSKFTTFPPFSSHSFSFCTWHSFLLHLLLFILARALIMYVCSYLLNPLGVHWTLVALYSHTFQRLFLKAKVIWFSQHRGMLPDHSHFLTCSC